MMKKTILVILIISLFLLILGCSKSEDRGSAETLLGDESAFDFGEFATFDSNGDGYLDRFVYTFDREEVAQDLFLQESVEYVETDEGLMGELILEFENTGDETKTYSYTQIIPKSFAESVDDLEFSIPPDEIIDPDPEVSWDVEIVKDTIERIVAKAKKAAEEIGKKAGMEAAKPSAEDAKAAAEESFEELEKVFRGDEDASMGKVMSSAWSIAGSGIEALETGKETGIKAGSEAAIGAMLDSIDDFALIHAVEKCARLPRGSKERDLCILKLVARFPGTFTGDYAGVCDFISTDETYRTMCKAIADYDIRLCDTIVNEYDSDLCKAVAAKSLCGIQSGPVPKPLDEVEQCICEKAVSSRSLLACSLLKDDDKRNECLALVTGESKYCQQIKDEKARQACLVALGEKGVVYDIDNWFEDTLESNVEYAEGLQKVIGPCFKVGSQGGCRPLVDQPFFWCSFSCTPNDHAWVVEVNIKPFSTDMEAQKEWNKMLDEDWNPAVITMMRVESPDHTITTTDTMVQDCWPEQIGEGGGKTLYTLMRSVLYKNCHILVTEQNAAKPGGDVADKAEQWAKQIIDEKRSITK